MIPHMHLICNLSNLSVKHETRTMYRADNQKGTFVITFLGKEFVPI